MSRSPEPRLSSPVFSTPGRYTSERPESPLADSSLRSRFSSVRPDEASGDSSTSPTSTTISNLSRSAFRTASTVSMPYGTPVRKVIIRADLSLVTCFDPADKELYDLWAPKR